MYRTRAQTGAPPIPKPKWWAQGLCSLVFFSLGLPFLHYPGPQQDELISVAPLYLHGSAVYEVSVFGHTVPVMVISYLGALKTWLYAPLCKVVGASYLSVRLPPLFLGSLTIWLLFHWLEMAHSRRAAWIAALLIATDTTFLLTTCFDWGPVALQHLLTLLGVVLVLHFHRRGARVSLAAGFLCFGLAFWDKALFAWTATGLCAAALVLFSREIRTRLTWKNAAAATAAFCMGVSPLIAYNVLEKFPTFHAASGFAIPEFYAKRFIARDTWEGAALFGFLVNEDTASDAHAARNRLEATSFGLRSVMGEHRRNALTWAGLAAGIMFIPALWWKGSRRSLLFCLIVTGVAWVLMGVTKGAGASAHHVVLLWPFPHAALAVIFAETSRRLGGIGQWMIGIGIAVLLGANLLVTDQYLYQFARDGAGGSWSDAIYPLVSELRQTRPRGIAIMDWGISNPVEVLAGGLLAIRWVGDHARPGLAVLSDPDVLWLGHTDGREQFTGVNDRFDAFVREAGFEETGIRMYADSNGRPVLRSFWVRKR